MWIPHRHISLSGIVCFLFETVITADLVIGAICSPGSITWLMGSNNCYFLQSFKPVKSNQFPLESRMCLGDKTLCLLLGVQSQWLLPLPASLAGGAVRAPQSCFVSMSQDCSFSWQPVFMLIQSLQKHFPRLAPDLMCCLRAMNTGLLSVILPFILCLQLLS